MVAKQNILRSQTLKLAQTNAAFMALVAGRIYPRSMAELSVDSDGVDVSNVVFPCSTFRIVGGSSISKTGAISTPQLLIQHWSQDDYAEAWELAAAFQDAVHRQRVDNSSVKFVWDVTNEGQEVFDPDRQLYYIVQQFQAVLLG